MSGINFSKVVFDTNAFIYFIGGDKRLEKYSTTPIYISEFTEMELKGRFGISKKELIQLERILEDCTILSFNHSIKKTAIAIRNKKRIKLPDALIAATAIWIGLPLVSSDGDFKNISGLNLLTF